MLRIATFVLTALASAVALTAQERVNPRAEALKGFNDRVSKYVELKKRLEEALPPLHTSSDATQIAERGKALQEAIRSARADAKPGDIFTPDVANQFRTIIETDLKRRSVRSALAAMQEVPQKFTLKINAEYPPGAPLATVPPLLLDSLQRLPDGVEYRLLGRHLILRDATANLILDYVLNFVPPLRHG
jgi:hypothetical protein